MHSSRILNGPKEIVVELIYLHMQIFLNNIILRISSMLCKSFDFFKIYVYFESAMPTVGKIILCNNYLDGFQLSQSPKKLKNFDDIYKSLAYVILISVYSKHFVNTISNIFYISNCLFFVNKRYSSLEYDLIIYFLSTVNLKTFHEKGFVLF